MKSKYLLILFVFLFFITLSAQNNQLTIATFNCEFLTSPKVHLKYGLPFRISDASDSLKQLWNAPGYRASKLLEAAAEVAKVIKMTDADVIALTEIGDENDIEILNIELDKIGVKYEYKAVCNSRDFTTKQHVGVLSKFELFDLIAQIPGRESYIKEPDDPETEFDTGISKGMRISFNAYGKEFLLYVLHLSSERGGHDQDQQRISQASIARRHMLPHLKANSNIIVCGDLNDKKGQPTLLRIRGLDDIHEDLIQTGHVKYFDKDKLDTRWTYEYQGVKQQIDHILLSYGIKDICKRGGISARTIEHNNHLASDHKPFIVTLELK